MRSAPLRGMGELRATVERAVERAWVVLEGSQRHADGTRGRVNGRRAAPGAQRSIERCDPHGELPQNLWAGPKASLLSVSYSTPLSLAPPSRGAFSKIVGSPTLELPSVTNKRSSFRAEPWKCSPKKTSLDLGDSGVPPTHSLDGMGAKPAITDKPRHH